jgi:hypothetical protein
MKGRPAPRPRSRLIAGRPRFVVALVAGAALLAPLELVRGWTGRPAVTAGLVFGSHAPVSGALALALAVFYAVVGTGLWRKLAWARAVAMVWLGGLLAAIMLLWSPDGYGAGAASGALLWQISAVPFLTFAMMYLYRGERWFR